jgi:hypothetical protein
MRKKNICTKIIKHTDIFCLFVYDSKPKMKTVMFSVLALSVVDCGFKADYNIGIGRFSIKHADIEGVKADIFGSESG